MRLAICPQMSQFFGTPSIKIQPGPATAVMASGESIVSAGNPVTAHQGGPADGGRRRVTASH